VVPDLATFGKGMANGFPLSAIVGRREHMRRMEDIFFSTTFGGETLSLAAAKVVLDRLRDEAIPTRLAELGTVLKNGLAKVISTTGCDDVFGVSGHPSWTFLNIRVAELSAQYEIKTLLLQELFANAFLFLGTHNLSAAHTHAHVDALLDCYRGVLPQIASCVRAGDVRAALRTEPLKPLFKVR